MTDLEYHELKAREERDECARLREKERNDKMATTLRNLFQSFLDSGFSEEQAWELFKGMIRRAWDSFDAD